MENDKTNNIIIDESSDSVITATADKIDPEEKKLKQRQTIFAVLIGVLVLVILGVCIGIGIREGWSGGNVISGGTSDNSDNSDSLEGSYIAVAGNYEITGENQCIVVSTTGDVKLILNDATINCDSGPAIYIAKAGDVEIVLKGENTISATTSDELEGVIHSKEDLVISGDGSLTVTGNLDGIVSKDTLTINGGNYVVKTGDDCIKGKDNVIITGGTFGLTSTAGDGIKSTNDEDTTLGFIKISGGEITMDVAQDGIQAETNVTISGGKITIGSGDDAIHANGKLEISGGVISIDAHEGLEATYVLINDGAVNISASDDGINAGSKSDLYAVAIEINGGSVTIDMGTGDTDAVDSNGNLTITGGTLNITAQLPFDYDGPLTYTGGTIIVNGETINEITNQFMGGGMGGAGVGGAPTDMSGGQQPMRRW